MSLPGSSRSPLWTSLSPEEESRWDAERSGENLSRLGPILLVIVLLNLSHVAAFWLYTPGGEVQARWRHLLLSAHGGSLVVTLLGLLVWWRWRASPRVGPRLPALVSMGSILLGVLLALFDQLVTPSLTPLVLANIGMAFLLRLSPRVAVAQFAAGAILFVALAPSLQPGDAMRLTTVLNAGSIGLLGAALSLVFTAVHRRDFAQRATIARQHAALEAAIAEAREQAGRADAANEAKSQFLASMSHEIRTPLGGVIGLAGILETTDLSAEQRPLVKTLSECGDLLLVVINSILDFSKIEAGQVEIERLPTDVRALVEGVRRLFSTQASRRGLRLEVVWSDDGPLWVIGDPTRLRQVLSNLVANALKFTEKGGERSEVACPPGGPQARLAVRVVDSGIGISPEQLERLFSPFVQADSSTTRRYGGTGLGLAISKRLVELMGGAIGATATPGEGSTFWFEVSLPRCEPVQVAGPAPASLTPRCFSGRILLVEDNRTNVLVATAVLRKLGFDVLVASDGQEALALQSDQTVDLVLTDMQMPVMDGLDLARSLRARGFAKPIIALTANVRAEDRARCIAAGMDDFLSKPFKLEEIEQVLQRWLGTETSRG